VKIVIPKRPWGASSLTLGIKILTQSFMVSVKISAGLGDCASNRHSGPRWIDNDPCDEKSDCALSLVLTLVPPAARAAEPVDMLLVLAADVSRSVTEPKFKLQREGAAAAITDPDVVKAMTSGPNRRIAVCFVEWATAINQNVVVDWTVIGDGTAARSFGDRLVEAPRSFIGSTSISGAIDFAVRQLERAPFISERRVIDISGDGNNNSGRAVTDARDDAVAKSITINALVILTPLSESFRPEHTNPPGGLEKYFQDNVIGGYGAFTVVADGHESFGRALTKKLIQEIAGLPRHRLAAAE
jgi:hypothetical protein